MNKKIRFIIALSVLILTFSGAINANAGLLDWATGQNTEWTFENVYNGITKQADKPSNPAIQETVVQETKNPITPVKTRSVAVRQYVVLATAYSSTIDQTDSTPFITASGTYVRDGIVAANFLPFGTMFKIPDLFGDKVFIVEDRMHRRFSHRVDIWFPERQMAREFGVKQIRIEIVS